MARIVKGKIEKTTLSQICKFIREVYDIGICYIEILLDFETISILQLNINNILVVESILATPKIGLKERFIRIMDDNTIRVYPADNSKENMYHNIQHLRRLLPNVIVSGIPTITRAVVNKLKGEKSNYDIIAEGTNLQAIMAISGVDGTKTTSNNVLEIENTLGIEAARKTIMNEINYTMSSYGLTIDIRHIMLVADLMTCRGCVLGITRFGISKMKDSVIMLASFEKTTDHLFDAAIHSRVDEIKGVSECIIMGNPILLGTGSFKVFHDVKIIEKEKKTPLFLNKNFNLDFVE